MVLENEKEKFDQLVDEVSEYAKTQRQLVELIAAEKTSLVFSSVVTALILLSIFFLTLTFAGISLGWLLSAYFGSTAAGFIAVTGIYFLTGLLLFANREKWLKTPLMNALIKNFFRN